MKKAIVAGVLFLMAFNAKSQNIQNIKIGELEEMMNTKVDHLRIFNFWASWCGPCVKELPHFNEVNGMQNVEVILVSLDFIQDQHKPKALLAKKGINLDSYLLDETDYDLVIPAVSENWSGAIPASLVVKPDGRRIFYEKSFELDELKQLVKLNTK